MGEVELLNNSHNNANLSDNTPSVPGFVFLVGDFTYFEYVQF